MHTLRLACFQSTQTWLNDQPLTHFPRVKAQALLIYLATEQNGLQDRPHRREALADLLWPDSPESRAKRNLSQTLMDLRRTLGDTGGGSGREGEKPLPFLLTTTQTIAINPNSELWTDVAAFETAMANDAYADAVELYRGPFLADFDLPDSDLFESWVLTQRENLHRRALEAFRKLSLAHEQQGELEQARQVVERLLIMAPWQEEAHAQLMRLLALSGTRSAALAQFDTLSQMLMDELGVSPSEETNVLYDQILAGEIEVGVSPIHASVAMPSPRTPFQVTAALPHFVGREDEIEQMRALLIQPGTQVVALVGMGGLGKTTLATQVAHSVRADFPDGVLWANPTISSVMDILDNWGKAYGYDFSGLSDIESRGAAVRGVLAEKSALLLLDNVTHASQVKPLLASGDQIPLLLTTRDLDVAHALNAAVVPLAELSAESGRELLINILGSERVQAEEAEAAQICALLHHLPLAVEIAAQRLKSRGRMSLGQMAQRLGDTSQRLGLKISDQAVRTSFEVSWAALDEELKALFPLLALFDGRPFTTEALAHVVEIDKVAEMDEYDVEDLLYGLNALSLVNEDEAAYFRQHPLLADFSREKLSNADSAYGRLVDYYLAFAQENQQNYDLLEPEWGNMMAAIEAANRLERWAKVLAFTNALSQTWLTRARYAEARQAYALAQGAAMKLGDEEAQAKTLLRWGEVCVEQNDYDEAKEHLTVSMSTWMNLEEDHGVADSHYHLARIAVELEQYDEAEALLQSCLELRIIMGDLSGMGSTKYNQALIRFQQNELENAGLLLAEALQHHEDAQNKRNMIPTLRLMAQLSAKRYEFSVAYEYCQKAQMYCEELQDEGELAATYYTLTIIHRRQGNFKQARAHGEQALSLFQKLGLKRSEGMTSYQLSATLKELKEYNQALTYGLNSLEICDAVQNNQGKLFSLVLLGDLYKEVQEADKSQATWQEACTLATKLNYTDIIEQLQERLSTH